MIHCTGRHCRAGLRRVCDADGGERGRREPQRRGRHAVPRRRGRRQQGQGGRGGAPGVRRQGLMRGHPRHGRTRRRLAGKKLLNLPCPALPSRSVPS
jgi:hypothetical protein